LATTTQKIHYLWTYGPTAVFSVLAVFWGALEYQTKITMPWKLMAGSPRTAKDTLLLDYISPNPIVVLWKSMRAKHWPVLVSVFGSQLIILVTIISTGLSVLESTIVQQKEVPMTVRRFDDTNFDASLVDALPVLAVSSIMSGNISVAYPSHTNEFIAIEPFAPVRNISGSELSKAANVNIFLAGLDCHLGHVANVTMLAEDDNWQLVANLSDSICTTDVVNLGARYDSGNATIDRTWKTVGAASLQSCQESGSVGSGSLVLTFAQAIKPKKKPPAFYEKGKTEQLPIGSFEFNATVLFCTPTNNMEQALVTTNSSEAILDVADGHTGSMLNLSSWDMALAFNNSVSSATRSFTNRDDLDLAAGMAPYDTYFKILQAISPGDTADYLDPNLLEADSRRLFTAVWAQIANQHLLSNTTQVDVGTYRVNQLRLLLRPVTSYIMEAGIVALLICALVMLFIRPIVPDLEGLPSPGRIAAILARSKDLLSTFKHTGVQSKQHMEHLILQHRYTMDSQLDGNTVTIKELRSFPTSALPSRSIKWWRPMALSAWMQVLLLLLPLAVVSSLEITYHISVKHQGLSDVTDRGYLHYTWTVIPALILTIIKTLGQSLAFSIEILDPHLVLKAGSGTAKQTLFHDYLYQTSLSRCLSSVRFGRWAVLSVSISTLLSPFLTIVVSGLFEGQPVAQYQRLTTDAVDHLTNFDNISYQNCEEYGWEQATLNAANLLIQQAIPFPKGIFDDYIYPLMTAVPQNTSTTGVFNASSMFAITPGYHPHTVCEALDPSEFQYTLRNDGSNDGTYLPNGEPYYYFLNFTHPAFTGCDCSSPQYTSTYCTTSDLLSLGVKLDPNTTVFQETMDVAYAIPLGWMKSKGWPNSSALAHSNRQCPNITMIYGDWDPHSNTSVNLGGVACYYSMEEAQLNISYALPQQTVTAISSINSSLVQADPNCWPFSLYSINDYLANNGTLSYDGLFMTASNGSKEQTLFTPGNADALAGRVSKIFDTFLAQYFSLNLRNTNFTTGSSRVPLTLVDSSRQRLFQSRVSTSILEGLLGIIWVCTVIALVLFDSKELLPKDPCSIAAQASLFADSEFIDMIPPGAERLSDKELAETAPFKDHLFSLGWWEKEDEAERTFGIDVGQAVSTGPRDTRWTRIKKSLGV
ncbi:hypothetical protein KCU95_g7404, partial [Aureobasidium melanogenum]